MEQKYNRDGTVNIPKYNNVEEFHLMPLDEAKVQGYKPFSLFLTKNQRLIYKRRRHFDSGMTPSSELIEDLDSSIHIIGFEEEIQGVYFSSYCALLPGGRIEWSHDFNHITMYERNLDIEPLKFYEV